MIPFEEAKVRFHGNGFLQAEDGKGGKFHMWHPACPRQKVQTLLHNHNHTFRSTLLHGELEYKEFDVRLDADGWYESYRCVPRKGKDTELRKVGIVNTIELAHGVHEELTTYEFELGRYHRIRPHWSSDIVITHVERIGEEADFQPTVLVRQGVTPDNDFDRYGHPELAKALYVVLVAMVTA